MSIKKFLALLLAGTAAVVAVGCGGTDSLSSDTQKEDTSKEESTEESAEESDEVVEIRFAQWEGGETLGIYEAFAEKFNAEHPNIHLTIMNIPEEYDTKITAMIAGGDAPEVCMMESSTILFPLAEEGAILDLQEYIDNDPDFDTSAIDEQFAFRPTEDTMIGYGMGAENLCMFYNPSLFAEYGVEEPPASYADAWDWETFVYNAQLMTIDKNGKNALDPEFDPENIDVYGVTFAKWWGMYMPFIYSVGEEYVTEDGTSVGYATEAGREVFQNLADLIYKYHVAPAPTVEESLPGLTERIASGKVAMVMDGQWNNATLMQEGIEYNVAALPKMGEEARTVKTFSAISLMNTEKADAAWEVVKAIISEVGACEELQSSGLWLPTNKNEYNDEYMQSLITDEHPSNYYETNVKPMLDGTAGAQPTQYTKNYAAINAVLDPALDDLWYGEKTADEVFDAIEDEANALVQGFYGR